MYINNVVTSNTRPYISESFSIKFDVQGVSIPWFEFPFSNESLTENMIQFVKGSTLMSAIKNVYVTLNGQKIVATLNEETGKYEASITAPAASSWSQADHVYKAVIHAEDAAGNVTEMNSDDATYGPQLKIRVLEKTAPTAVINSPTQDALLGENTQTVKFTLKDAGGSGLNMDTVVLKVDSAKITSGITYTDGDDGSKVGTYSAKSLTDGTHTITVDVTDNDGNAATTAKITFMISTAAPTLTVTTPANNLITNATKVTVAGTAKPGTSMVTVASVKINGVAATVNSDGNFSYEQTLTEGVNTITIIATDSLGKNTSITRTVTLDTKKPVISDVVASATTVAVGGTLKITFKVTDPA